MKSLIKNRNTCRLHIIATGEVDTYNNKITYKILNSYGLVTRKTQEQPTHTKEKKEKTNQQRHEGNRKIKSIKRKI